MKFKELWLIAIALSFFCSASAQTSNEKVVKLFTSTAKTVEVGEMTITSRGGVLKCDFDNIPLNKFTLKKAKQLWGLPIKSKNDQKYEQKTFELWGASSNEKKLEKYLLDTRFLNNKLSSYRLNGNLIAEPAWMAPEADTLKRAHGPREGCYTRFEPGIK